MGEICAARKQTADAGMGYCYGNPCSSIAPAVSLKGHSQGATVPTPVLAFSPASAKAAPLPAPPSCFSLRLLLHTSAGWQKWHLCHLCHGQRCSKSRLEQPKGLFQGHPYSRAQACQALFPSSHLHEEHGLSFMHSICCASRSSGFI